MSSTSIRTQGWSISWVCHFSFGLSHPRFLKVWFLGPRMSRTWLASFLRFARYTLLRRTIARPQSQADIPATIQSGGQSAVQSVTQSTALSSSQSSAGHSAKRPRPNAQTPRMSKRVKTSITTSPWIFRK